MQKETVTTRETATAQEHVNHRGYEIDFRGLIQGRIIGGLEK